MSLIMILGGVIFQGNITIIPEFFCTAEGQIWNSYNIKWADCTHTDNNN